MITKTEYVELLTKREGNYTMYVFKNLNTGNFIMCTRMPNWQTPEIQVGSKGYLQYNIVSAGDEYYHPDTDTHVKYHYSNLYYINFVQESEKINNNGIII